MFSLQERKQERMNNLFGDTMSSRKYNLIIGGCLLYGFILNALIVGAFGNFFMGMNPIIFLIGYIVCCIAGVMLTRSNSPAVSFLGYNLVVVPIGAVLSVCLPAYNGMDIFMAIVITGIVVLGMTCVASAYPAAFAKMGRTLFVTLIIGLIAELLAVFLFGYVGNLFNLLFVAVFSLYIGYDWCRAQAYPKTLDNAIDSACDLYLDIINIFIRLLAIFGNRD